MDQDEKVIDGVLHYCDGYEWLPYSKQALTEQIADSNKAYELLFKENGKLRALLAEAADEIEDWGAYASEYFQQKHGLAECVAKFRNEGPNAQ